MIDVALDARITPRMSAGVRAYVKGIVAGVPRVAPDIALHALGRGRNFSLAEQVDLPAAIARLLPAVTHYPTVFAPLRRRKPYVATMHDLIHLEYPQFFSRATAVHYALVGAPLLRDAALVLVHDERTIAAGMRLLAIPADRYRVVPLAYDADLLVPTAPLITPRPFVFYAGNHRPHKNLAVLFEAWSALAPAVELDLVCTGPDDAAARERFARGGSELRFAGALSATDLARHYRSALAYVHPALTEGFGLPMLEATVVGTPVVASETCVPRPLLPFVATFPPHDVLALRALLVDVVADPSRYRRRAAEGSAVVRAYTWDRFAAAVAAVYREVAHGSDRS